MGVKRRMAAQSKREALAGRRTWPPNTGWPDLEGPSRRRKPHEARNCRAVFPGRASAHDHLEAVLVGRREGLQAHQQARRWPAPARAGPRPCRTRARCPAGAASRRARAPASSGSRARSAAPAPVRAARPRRPPGPPPWRCIRACGSLQAASVAASRLSLAMCCTRMRWRPHWLTMCQRALARRRPAAPRSGARRRRAACAATRVDVAQRGGVEARGRRVHSCQARCQAACARVAASRSRAEVPAQRGWQASRGCRARAAVASRLEQSRCRASSMLAAAACAARRTRRCDSMRNWPARFIAVGPARSLAPRRATVRRCRRLTLIAAPRRSRNASSSPNPRAEHQHALSRGRPTCVRRAAHARSARDATQRLFVADGVRCASACADTMSAAATLPSRRHREHLPVMDAAGDGEFGVAQRQMGDRRGEHQHARPAARRPSPTTRPRRAPASCRVPRRATARI